MVVENTILICNATRKIESRKRIREQVRYGSRLHTQYMETTPIGGQTKKLKEKLNSHQFHSVVGIKLL